MEHQRHYHNRFYIVGLTLVALCLLGLLFLVARVAYLQIFMGQKYHMQAHKNRVHIQFTPPARGKILDRHGRPLANNKIVHNAVINLRETSNISQAITEVNKLIPLEAHDIERALKFYKQNRGHKSSIIIKPHLTWDEIVAVEANQNNTPYLIVEEGIVRTYTLSEKAVHPLGYTGMIDPNEKDKFNIFSQIPDVKVGKTGLEKTFNPQLIGMPGITEYEVNARGKKVRKLARVAPTPGENVITTLDLELQQYVYDRISEHKAGTAVVVDIETGGVVAMVSYPGFDPDLFSKTITPAESKEMFSRVDTPFSNKAISGIYPPASVIKPFALLAGLEANVISKKSSVLCTGRYTKLNDYKPHCWKKHGHGTVDAARSIRESCDVFFYELGVKLKGITPLSKVLEEFGFGKKHNISLSGERSGLVPSPLWKKRVKMKSWFLADTMQSTIGQGFLLATPLQMVMSMAMIANGGYKVRPVFTVDKETRTEKEKLNVSETNVKYIQDLLRQVMNSPGGTGARFKKPGEPSLAGKTGTSQVRRITQAERESGRHRTEVYEWIARDHAIFAGYGPTDKPKYAVVVLIEHGGWGRNAVPIGRDILFKALELDKAKPELQPQA